MRFIPLLPHPTMKQKGVGGMKWNATKRIQTELNLPARRPDGTAEEFGHYPHSTAIDNPRPKTITLRLRGPAGSRAVSDSADVPGRAAPGGVAHALPRQGPELPGVARIGSLGRRALAPTGRQLVPRDRSP